MTVPQRAASLSRVSTQAQAHSSRFGIPVQRSSNRAYIERIGAVLGGEYIDQVSGVSETREAFYRLLAEAEKYDIVVVYDVSRIGRDEELSHRFMRLMWEAGLEIHSVHRGGIVERGLATSAEIMISAETRRTIIRTTQNARVAMAEDGLNPSGIRNYGYLSAKGRAHHHLEHAPIVKRIYNLAASGVSYRMIADTLNQDGVPPSLPERQETYLEDGALKKRTIKTQWHTSTISHLVRNPVYHQGYATWRHYRIQLEPLISTQVWHKAQRRVGAPARHDWALIGHLRCGYCGRRMSARRSTSRGKTAESYKCQSIDRPRCLFGLSRRKTEARVEAEVREVLSDPVSVAALFRTPGPDAAVAEKLAALDVESREAFETWRRGIITPDELGQVRRELEVRRAELATISAPDPHPVEALEEFADMTLREVLELMPIVATLTRDDVTLGIE